MFYTRLVVFIAAVKYSISIPILSRLPQQCFRFESFAPETYVNRAKWFVDGQDYMASVADAIKSAREEILITDWQMNPYIFMKRPITGVDSLEWRLDKMLLRKAEEGVRVYILLYWETQVAMDLGSGHTQSMLNNLHENISVLRHPDFASAFTNPTTVYRWSHHEKLVIVDRKVAFVGGIDLCYGRWDTHDHELMDDYPFHPHATRESTEEIPQPDTRYSRWIGKDYSNTFFKTDSSINWERPFEDYQYVTRSQIPRMPWHDVACVFSGPAVSDAVKHFSQTYYALQRSTLPDLYTGLTSDYTVPDSYGNLKIQVLRSVSSWSAGQPHEHSIYDAYLYAIRNAKHYIYIENQFFISSQPSQDWIPGRQVENQIQSELAERIYRAYSNAEDFHVMVMMPLKSEFGPEDWKSDSGLTALSYWNYATIFSGEHSLFAKLKEKGMPPQAISSYFCVYGLRTHGSLNGNLATEIIYVHSKLMIVDDRLTIIGSANINDRSMLGDRDSEIAVIIEDVDMIDAKWNGVSDKVGKFSRDLRFHLQKEHLGLLHTEGNLVELNVEDPLAFSFYTGVLNQATQNTLIYEQVFRKRILPTDQVWNKEDLENWKTFEGLIDVAPNLAIEALKEIRGNIVEMPRHFLVETLKPSFLDYFKMYVDNRGTSTSLNFGETPTVWS